MDLNNQDDMKNIDLPKLPFKRLKLPLSQLVDIAIPLHIQLLEEQSLNLDALIKRNASLELRLEQVRAAKTVQLLKQDLFELEKVNLQVREEDKEYFQQMIEMPIRNTVNVLSAFMSVHTDILEPFLDMEDTNKDKQPPLLVLYPGQTSDATNKGEILQPLEMTQVQDTKSFLSGNWSILKGELMEVHALVKKFSSLVFHQQEDVDSIHSNIVQTQENVQVGKEYLKKASLLKAATFPLAGAILGGLTLGPVGVFVGFKLVGCAAFMAGGSVFGYGVGVKLKQKQEQEVSSDMEMKALTFPDKQALKSDNSYETESKKDR